MIKHRLHRLKLKITQIIFLVSALWLLVTPCYAQQVSSRELIENAQEYDAREVVYEGEVIGEVMKRKDGVWANIYDGEHSIGVWLPPELIAVIEYSGSYKAKGDLLRVRGIFNRACIQHGGDLDIHATHLTKIKSGWLKQEKLIPAKRNLLIILSVILCLILVLKVLIIR